VYSDKLTDDKDIDSFTKMQHDIVKKSFEEIDESVIFDKPNIYCHFDRVEFSKWWVNEFKTVKFPAGK